MTNVVERIDFTVVEQAMKISAAGRSTIIIVAVNVLIFTRIAVWCFCCHVTNRQSQRPMTLKKTIFLFKQCLFHKSI